MRPNILVLHCHDLGRFLGCYGHPTVRTPHLDAFAADGVRFDAAFCAAPQCSPSRASLFTGRWPHATGVMGLTHADFAWDLRPGERHLGELLREQGYETVMLGVQHETRPRGDDVIAERLGFDHVDTSDGRAARVADRAVAYLREARDPERPFFLDVGFVEPHRLRAPDDERGVIGFLGDHLEPDDELGVQVPPYLHDTEGARAEVAELQGAVHHMDAAAGRVLDALDTEGLADDTLVVFTTDHGLALPRAKCSLYDAGIEVALLVRYPGRGWTGGRAVRELVSNVDLVPTVLDLLGVGPPDDLHGVSLVPLLDEVTTEPPRDAVYAEITYHDYYDPRRCVRTERYKLVANFSNAPLFMDSSQSWVRRSVPVDGLGGKESSHPPLELYDLAADPHELRNLAADDGHREIVDALAGRLFAWMSRTSDPLLDGAVTPPVHTRTLSLLSSAATAP